MSDWGTRAFVVAKEGTGANIARTPETETKAEGIYLFSSFLVLFTVDKFTIKNRYNTAC